MNTVMKIFLSMSFSGSLLILALLLGKQFFKDKISRQWQYYIWLLVVLRLLLPFGPETNLLGNTYKAVDEAITQAAPPSQGQSSFHAPASSPPPAVDLEQDTGNANRPAEDLAAAHPLQDMRELLTEHVWLIWLAAALGLLIRKVTIYQGFMRYIKTGLTPVSDMDILDRLSIAAEQAGVRKPVELCVNPLISSPLLIGFFRPCIVLPSGDISETDFQYIALHELTHCKRRDMFYKWLVQVTVCLHWFNPLVHLMSREITKACEFSCDEAVLEKMGDGSAQDYGQTLLDAMAAVGRYKEHLGSVTLSEHKQLLKERLGAIMKFKKPSGAVRMLTAALTLCVALGASFVGIYGTGSGEGNAHAASPAMPPDTTGRPSLSLDVKNAAVNVLPAADGKISAEYNQDVYAVEISGQDSRWEVSISCKTRTNTNDETIQLYIPDIDYGNVTLSADSGHLTCGMIRSGDLTGSFHMASVFLTLPEGFAGSLKATADSGYFQLVSRDDFRNATATITDDGDWGEIYRPKSFKENGKISTFTDGTGDNIIQVTRKGSGVMGIYTSDAFDTSNFPEEWSNLWQGQWQDAPWEDDWWEDDWWQDTWQEAAGNSGSAQRNTSVSGTASFEAEQYYDAGNLPLFQIAFSRLDEEAQGRWLDKIYADGQIAFWGAAAGLLDQDGALIQRCAEKTYESGSIAYFSTLVMHMSRDMVERWLAKAQEDGNWAFQSVLFNALDQNGEFDQLKEQREKEWEEAQKAEYGAAGITVEGKDYYYQGQLVNIFLDIRSNQSFYTLNMNPKGTVNIKILRNENNEITEAAYMTDEEVAEFFGNMDDMEDPEDESPFRQR